MAAVAAMPRKVLAEKVQQVVAEILATRLPEAGADALIQRQVVTVLTEELLAASKAARARSAGREVATSRKSVEAAKLRIRSEEHTSELQSLMRISYAVFCLKKQTDSTHSNQN